MHPLRTLPAAIRVIRNWPIYALQALGIPDTETTYRLRAGVSIRLRENGADLSEFTSTWLDRVYDPNTYGLDFNWRDAKRIVDIGGGIGAFALFATCRSPEATVCVLEPETLEHRALTQNVERNDLGKRVRALQVGLGDGSPRTIHLRSNQQTGRTSDCESLADATLTIQTISLETLFQKHDIRHCDLLKMQCSRGEYEAIFASPQDILHAIHVVIVLCGPDDEDPTHTPEYLATFLQRRGFEVQHRNRVVLGKRML